MRRSRWLEAGADAVKVGIGPGQSAPRASVAAVGVPQISAIAGRSRCAQRTWNVPVIGRWR